MSKFEASFNALKRQSNAKYLTQLGSYFSNKVLTSRLSPHLILKKNERIFKYFNSQNRSILELKNDNEFALKVMEKFKSYFPSNEVQEIGFETTESKEGFETITKLKSNNFINESDFKLKYIDSLVSLFESKNTDLIPTLSNDWVSKRFTSDTSNVSLNVFRTYSTEDITDEEFNILLNDSINSYFKVGLFDENAFALNFLVIDCNISNEAKLVFQENKDPIVLVVVDDNVDIKQVIPPDIAIAQILPKELIDKINVTYMRTQE